MNVKLATQLLPQSTVEMIQNAISDEIVVLAYTSKAYTITLRIFVSIGIPLLTYAMVGMDHTHHQMQLKDKLAFWICSLGFLDGRNFMTRW
jgi:hypothetical protein